MLVAMLLAPCPCGASELSLGGRTAVDPFDGGSLISTGVVGSVSALSPSRRALLGVLGSAGVLFRPGFDGSYLFAETGIGGQGLPFGSSVLRFGMGGEVTIVHILGGFTSGTASLGLVVEWTGIESVGIRFTCGPRVRVVLANHDPERLGAVFNASFFWR